MKRIAVIMAGGGGERFWPLSRKDRPKQLLRLTHPSRNMLEEAVHRVEPLFGTDQIYIATGRTLAHEIQKLDLLDGKHVWTEPTKRNTLGAILWTVANLIASDSRDTTVAILTTDHRMAPPEKFRDDVRRALEVAEATGGLVTLGIRPDRPETGYGYIEYESVPDQNYLKAVRFKEKPDLATAEKYLTEARSLWNSGMFFWTVDGLLNELKRVDEPLYDLTLRIATALRTDIEEASKLFERLPDQSIDYALMEKAENVWMLPASFEWDDVGAWDALERTLPLDSDLNVVQGNVLALDSKGCIVYNDEGSKPVCVLGLENVVVVNTGDAVLVLRKDLAQSVKQVVQALDKRDHVVTKT